MKRLTIIKSLYITSTIMLFLLLINGCNTTNSGSNPGISFDSGTIPPGGTFHFSFNKTGTINYYCSIHAPDMAGKIIVSVNAQISGQDTVIMKNIQFVPSQVTITPNTTVVWVNADSVNHHVVSGSPSTGGGGYGGGGYGY